MTRPPGITGSLTPTFAPARAVALAVRRPFAFALVVRLPTALRAPSRASVTISEATAPVKLPASHGPRRGKRLSESVNKTRSEEHTSELQSLAYLVCRLLLEKKKKKKSRTRTHR